MVDVAHIIPPSPDDPPRRPSRIRPWHAAVALVAAVAVGGGLWAWKPWRSVELPEHACWSLLDKDDLKPLAGPDGKAVEPKPAREIATLAKPASGNRDYRCAVLWTGGASLLDVDIRPPWNGIDADRASDAGLGPITPLDFGPGATGWIVNHDRVRLYVSCDFQGTQPDTGRAAPPYVGVRVGGDHIDGTSPAAVGQAYTDTALKVGRAAATAYECRNTVQLPATAPHVPSQGPGFARGGGEQAR